MKTTIKLVHLILISVIFAAGLQGCGSTGTSKGASTGAVVGGLLDGWGGAAAGAIIGGGIGYASDHSEAKKKEQELKERELAALEKSAITSDSNTAYQPQNTNPLTGSTWRVISFVEDEKKTADFSSLVISFPTNTKSITLIQWADGRTETYSENYNVVNDALVLSGDGYVTNTKYSIQDKQMILVAPNMRVVLEEVEEGA
jgi:hypothetical protein